MAPKHDKDGFLIGESEKTTEDVVDELNTGMVAGQNTGNRLLGGIRTDVSAIAKALNVASRSSSHLPVAEPAGRRGASEARSSSPGQPAISAQRTGGFGAANARAAVAPGGRDNRGRFVAGAAGKPGGVEGGGGRLLDKLGLATDALNGLASGSGQMDPALAAMREVKDVVEPIGRGAFALLGRTGAQKKERWYQKIWKSLTNLEKKPAGGGPGGMPSMDSGDSSLMGGIAGVAARFIPAIIPIALTAIGAALAVGIGAFAGTAIGTAIYDWLTKSGLMEKIFKGVDAIKDAPRNFKKGEEETYRPPGSSNEHRKMEDSVPAPLAPSTSVAQSAGRAKGHAKNFLQEELGFSPVNASNDPGTLSKMDKGSRKRADFSGIDGGAMLAQNGTYTPAEAQRIKDLKSTGQNTGAFGKGGMTPEIMGKIETQAKAAGLDPVMMKKFAAMESGGNANAISKTGAIGVYQFTGKTATGVGIKDRFNADQNIAGGMALAKQNAAILTSDKNNLPVTAANLYMMHQLGPQAAIEVIKGAQDGKSKADLSPATQKAMNLNYGAKSAMASDYIDVNNRALDSRYAQTTGGNISKTTAPAIPGRAMQGMGTTATVTAGNVPMLTQSGVPSSVPTKLPAMPEVNIPAPSTEKDRPVSVIVRQPIGQDVGDRGIAHIVSGGMGAVA